MRDSENGFTLFEVVVTLIILGIVAGGAVSLFTNVVEGMILTRNATASAEKIQTALTRITHELAGANLAVQSSVVSGGNTLSYYYATDPTLYTVQRSGTNLTLNGNVLLDNIVNNGTGFTAAQNVYSVTITINVLVPMVSGTTAKTYTTVIDLNSQRF